MAQRDQRRRGQERQQTAHEGAPAPRTLGAQVADGVDRDHGEEDRYHGEDDETQRVEREPVAEDGGAGHCPERPDEREVRGGGRDHPGVPEPRRAMGVGRRGGDQRHQQEREKAHQSLSSVRRAELSESNSRLMWNTTMPMMNTPTKTSSSTPISTRNGTRSAWLSPKT